MFTALAKLAVEDPAAVELTPEQLRLIRAVADRHRTGFTTRDCAALRAVVADWVVRRDGTTSLAVRRYVTAYYDELFATDRKRQPQAVKDTCSRSSAETADPWEKSSGTRRIQATRTSVPPSAYVPTSG